MKGIILAAGSGSRLDPLTRVMGKHLLPVYDKPMIYYPLSTLLTAGVEEILLISTAHDAEAFRALLGDGSRFNVSLSYAVQAAPRGIADAFLVGADFIGADNCCLILGDNIFHGGMEFRRALREAAALISGALIFGHEVSDARPYGVVEFDAAGRILSLTEKPQQPKSRYIVPGLYFYDQHVARLARGLKPSARGELEITDLNRAYLARGELRLRLLPADTLWFDAGTPDTLLAAANAISDAQHQAGRLIGCPEESARGAFEGDKWSF